MKKFLILSAFLFFLVCAFFWLRRPPEKEQVPPEAISANNPSTNEPSSSPGQPVSSPAPSNRTAAGQRARQARHRDWNSRSNDFYQAWVNSNVPLDFYGKVVDEASNPIAGATVAFTWNKDDVTNHFRGGEN